MVVGHSLGHDVQHAPRQNGLLAALPPDDYGRLLPMLESFALPHGKIMHAAGEREQYLYFITAGIVARYNVLENGDTAEFALTGREGVIGIAAFLGGERTPGQAMVLGEGHAYRLKASVLTDTYLVHVPLIRLLLRFTQALIVQTGQIAACNRRHSVEQRLCRWILTALDRLPDGELAMTQEQLADSLGVRRESVTQAAETLQGAGLIHYHRGHIAGFDRRRLEARACECYLAVKREYARLLNHQGETDAALPPGQGRGHLDPA